MLFSSVLTSVTSHLLSRKQSSLLQLMTLELTELTTGSSFPRGWVHRRRDPDSLSCPLVGGARLESHLLSSLPLLAGTDGPWGQERRWGGVQVASVAFIR
jgi:hypothetical protein